MDFSNNDARAAYRQGARDTLDASYNEFHPFSSSSWIAGSPTSTVGRPAIPRRHPRSFFGRGGTPRGSVNFLDFQKVSIAQLCEAQ